MFNIADLIVIIIILIAVVRGYKNGFVKTGFGILSFLVALIITFMFYKPVMGIIKNKTGFEEWFSNYLYTLDVGKNTNKLESGEVNTTVAEAQVSYIDALPNTIVEMIGLEEFKENAKKDAVEKIVDFVVKLLAIIIVYIIARIILAIIALILDSIASLPILKQFNELLGLLLGGILGFLQVYFICAIMTLISSLSFAEGISSVIANSMFAHVLYNNNILLQILF